MANEWKEVSATWKGDLNFVGQNAEGGTVQMALSGNEPGIGPMQLVLVGLAGCTGIDMITIFQKKKVTLEDFKIIVRAKRAPSPPMVYTDIEVEYLLWGDDLKPKDIEQAIKLSEEKYCSVSIMLRKTAKIKSTYKILKPGNVEALGR